MPTHNCRLNGAGIPASAQTIGPSVSTSGSSESLANPDLSPVDTPLAQVAKYWADELAL
jgi:hypothetical protein